MKKKSCIENIRFWGEATENTKAPPILELEQNRWVHWI